MTMTATTPTAPEGALVAEACRLLEDAERVPTLPELARAVGARPDALRREFVRRLGVTPRQYADAVRRERLRAGLRDGEEVTRALFAAGYGSTSRLYEGAHTHLGMTPASYRAGGAGATVRWTTAPSPLGMLLVAATERGMCFLYLADADSPDPRADLEARLLEELPAAALTRDDDHLGPLVAEVVRRMEGLPPALDIPLDVQGTAFQRRVWEELRRIPLGETRTYGEVAVAIGSPRAVRAVGTACGHNPVAIVVPCHRVVPAAGGIGSYGFGPARKKRLLEAEAAQSDPESDPE